MLALLVIIAAAWLNRVRGGGFGGDKLPGRALFWVAPAMGALTLLVAPWPIALALALGYGFWGLFSWGHILAALGGVAPDRPPTRLESWLLRLGPVPACFLRMLFVLPGVAAIATLKGAPLLLLAAPVFAALATMVCQALLDRLRPMDWMRAEIAIGGLWGLVILLIAGDPT